MISQELSDVVLAALAAHEGVRCYVLPGTVVSYDSGACTADVRPGVRRAVPTHVDGETVTEALPVVFAARVLWPGGSGGYLHVTLSPGDPVLLLCCDDDPADFLRTGDVSDPGDVRRNRPGHAVCIPGLSVKPDIGLVAAKAAIGGSTDAAALASFVRAQIVLVAAALDAIAEAVSTANPYPASGVPPASAFGSTVLKVGS